MSKLLMSRLPAAHGTSFSRTRAGLVMRQSMDEDGIDLKTPMVLQPPFCIQVRSPKKFLVWMNDDAFDHNDTINPNSINPKWTDVSVSILDGSIFIYSERSPVKLVPEYTLGETFARCWNNLSEEIKVSSHSSKSGDYLLTLRQAMIIKKNMFCSVRPSFRTRHVGFEQVLFPYCRMTPEIARLATEAFYNNNEWLVELNSPINAIPRYNFNRYPSPILNNMIRRMYITMYIRPVHTNFLRKLSKGVLGFHNLKNLEITVEWKWPPTFPDFQAWHQFHTEATHDPVVFACDGSVHIEPASSSWIMTGARYAPYMLDKEILLRERIVFKGVNAKL